MNMQTSDWKPEPPLVSNTRFHSLDQLLLRGGKDRPLPGEYSIQPHMGIKQRIREFASRAALKLLDAYYLMWMPFYEWPILSGVVSALSIAGLFAWLYFR